MPKKEADEKKSTLNWAEEQLRATERFVRSQPRGRWRSEEQQREATTYYGDGRSTTKFEFSLLKLGDLSKLTGKYRTRLIGYKETLDGEELENAVKRDMDEYVKEYERIYQSGCLVPIVAKERKRVRN